jgi:hypothetical protein
VGEQIVVEQDWKCGRKRGDRPSEGKGLKVRTGYMGNEKRWRHR